MRNHRFVKIRSDAFGRSLFALDLPFRPKWDVSGAKPQEFGKSL